MILNQMLPFKSFFIICGLYYAVLESESLLVDFKRAAFVRVFLRVHTKINIRHFAFALIFICLSDQRNSSKRRINNSENSEQIFQQKNMKFNKKNLNLKDIQ